MKTTFIGTSEFGAIILEGLIKGGYKPFLVITMPDKPVGRKQVLTPPPVKLTAQKYNIPVGQSDLKSEIGNSRPDLGIVADYGKIIPKGTLDIPKFGCLNVHPSLLPKYRGPSPIQTTILNGDEETGVSIILMNEKIDAGPILANKSQILNSKITYKELHDKLAELGSNLLIETIPKWVQGEIKPVPQDETKATYTKIFKKEDGLLDWKKSAEELERQVRAFDPWPGTYAFWRPLKNTLIRIKILKSRFYKSKFKQTYPVGKVLVVPQNEIGVQCGNDFLVIESLQLEGKKEMAAEEFLRGHPDLVMANLNGK